MDEYFRREGPLLADGIYRDTKDPCPVFDGVRWHIFGSAGSSSRESWEILHAIAPAPRGPWHARQPATLSKVEGERMAAPGVVYDFETRLFHLFIQTDFLQVGGRVEHFTSRDGNDFGWADTSLFSVPGTGEAGIYDPHPAIIGGEKYLSYSGTPAVTRLEHYYISRPDIYLARSISGSWAGPWVPLGCILNHESVPHHNQPGVPDYEWGLEGSQLIELPGGTILLNAVCFLPKGERGARQRVFFAIADDAMGPYHTLGPVLETRGEGWESGENGHAAGIISKDTLYLYYQSRSRGQPDTHWRYGLATIPLAYFERMPSPYTQGVGVGVE
jgi:hypothetical protein